MADGMGSAWTRDYTKGRRKTDPSLWPQHTIEARIIIDTLTTQLADDRGGDYLGESVDAGYYAALDDLRAKLNLPPTDRSRRD